MNTSGERKALPQSNVTMIPNHKLRSDKLMMSAKEGGHFLVRCFCMRVLQYSMKPPQKAPNVATCSQSRNVPMCDSRLMLGDAKYN